MREYPQADHCDLGLIPDSDHTEDLRRNSETTPEPQVRQHPAGAVSEHPVTS